MKFFKIIFISISLFFATSITSKAYVFDVWTVEGVASYADLAQATVAFKEKAMAGGAKYDNIRASMKVRGDRSNDTGFVIATYENYQDMMETAAVVAQNPDWFSSTYGAIEVQGTMITSATYGNNQPLNDNTGGVGNTVGYNIVEVLDGVNFVLNFPKLQKLMAELGAPAAFDYAFCATCGEEIRPGEAVLWAAAATMEDAGKTMDIFASAEVQTWIYRNMRPFLNIVDSGVHTYLTE